MRHLLLVLRYGIPAAVCLAGVVIVAIAGVGAEDSGPEALAALLGAGGSIYLMNRFMRIGIAGDAERDVEEAGRLFLDRYGCWPDEVPAGWQTPDGHGDAATALAELVEQRSHSDVAA